MENLVGRKVKCVTNGYCNFHLHQDYIIVNESETMYVVQDNFGKHKDFSKHKFKYYFELLIDEPQFKQGDKILVSNDMVNWFEGIFICLYKDYKIVKAKDGTLRYATNIKPYEDEIKVGDWVHNSDGHVLKCKYLGLNNNPNWIKITNQDLIDKLNKL